MSMLFPLLVLATSPNPLSGGCSYALLKAKNKAMGPLHAHATLHILWHKRLPMLRRLRRKVQIDV